MTIDDDKGRAKDDSWTEERDGTGCCWTSVTCSQWTLLSSKHGCCLIFSVMNGYSGDFVPVMFLQSFLLSSWSSMSYKKTLSPFSSISASWKQVRGNDRPATDPPARERIFLVSTKRAPTRPPSYSFTSAQWYISLVVLVHGGTYH